MRASPRIGPTTAPAIQALLLEPSSAPGFGVKLGLDVDDGTDGDVSGVFDGETDGDTK